MCFSNLVPQMQAHRNTPYHFRKVQAAGNRTNRERRRQIKASTSGIIGSCKHTAIQLRWTSHGWTAAKPIMPFTIKYTSVYRYSCNGRPQFELDRYKLLRNIQLHHLNHPFDNPRIWKCYACTCIAILYMCTGMKAYRCMEEQCI